MTLEVLQSGEMVIGTGQKIHSIQMLRFFAASLVVVFHAHQALALRYGGGTDNLISYLSGFGAVGVHIFFVISGYIMVLTTSRADQPYSAQSFITRRLIRIYPVYWIFAALYLAVHFFLGSPYALSPKAIASALLLLPENSAAIIGPAWTLSFEMFFYLSFGIAMMLGRLKGLIALSAGFGVFIILGHALHVQGGFLKLASSSLLIEFLAGVWIAYISMRWSMPRTLGIAATALAILLFIAGLLWGYHALPSAIIWGVPSAILIFGVVTLEHGEASPLLRRLSALGESSYSLYLAHILIITLALAFIKATALMPSSLILWTITITVVAISAAHSFHHRVEAPMVRFLAARITRR